MYATKNCIYASKDESMSSGVINCPRSDIFDINMIQPYAISPSLVYALIITKTEEQQCYLVYNI